MRKLIRIANKTVLAPAPAGAVRQSDGKLSMLFEDGWRELCDLRDGIGETHNRAGDVPEAGQLRGLPARRRVSALV